MKVHGIDFTVLQKAANDLDMQLHNADRASWQAYTFTVRGKHSKTFYSRRGISGRRVLAVCFHGWRDFIRVAFASGATKVSSIYGRWESLTAFNNDLPRMAGLNVGSPTEPRTMPSLCTHEGPLPPLLTRVVKAARKEAQRECVTHAL